MQLQINKKLSQIPLAVLIVLFSAIFSDVYSQTTPWGDDGEIESAEVIIEKDLQINLPPASRNFEKVPPPPVQPQKTEQKYQFRNFNYEVRDLDPKIRVLTIKEEPLGKLYPNFIKGGLGNYITTYAEGYFNNTRNKDYAYGAHIRHNASARGPVDGANSGSSENSVALNGKYFTPNVIFSGDMRFDRDKYYFYGYNPVLEVDRADIRQVFNIFNAVASIENVNPRTIQYKLSGSFNALQDRFEARETQTGFNLESSFDVGKKLGFEVRSDLYLMNRRDEIGTMNRNFFRLRPNFLIRTDLLRIRGGFNFVFENDTVATGDQLHFYPFANLEYDLSENITAYAGIDGDMQRTSLAGFVNENPFLAPNVPLLHTNKTFDFFGGIKGKLMQNLNFNVGISSAEYNNMYFFVNSAQDSSRFDIIYDPQNLALLNLFAEIGFNKSEKIRTSIRGDYYGYSTVLVEEPWHKPNYKLTFLSTYNIYDKIHLNADVNLLGGIKAKNFMTDEAVDLPTIVDLNLKADYLFSDRFSVFLSFNNILSRNYERYLYYPSRGLMVLAGASYSF
ncbi:hypothetical protein BH23BAC1_BH23BAC1_13940 [soil metagenome]